MRHGASCRAGEDRREPRSTTVAKGKAMDLVFLGVSALFFLATWGFVRLCETL
ncbi:MAG: hypothetical protein U0230_23035 [Polyangiales bacterium]